MNRKITSDLAVRTLKKAIASQQEIKGVLILHSDQGILKLFCMRLLKILLIPSTTTGGLIHTYQNPYYRTIVNAKKERDSGRLPDMAIP